MNTNKLKLLGLAVLAGSPSLMLAQTAPDFAAQVTAVEGKIDNVGTVGLKAVGIAAGLTLAFVVVSYIRKARR